MDIPLPRELPVNIKRKFSIDFMNRFLILANSKKSPSSLWKDLSTDFRYLVEPHVISRQVEAERDRLREQVKILEEKVAKLQMTHTEGSTPATPAKPRKIIAHKPISPANPFTPLKYPTLNTVLSPLPPIKFTPEGLMYREGERISPNQHIEERGTMIESVIQEEITAASFIFNPPPESKPIDRNNNNNIFSTASASKPTFTKPNFKTRWNIVSHR